MCWVFVQLDLLLYRLLGLIVQFVGSLHLDLFVEQHVGSLCVCMGNKTTHIYHTYIIRSHCGFKNSTCIFGEIAVLSIVVAT